MLENMLLGKDMFHNVLHLVQDEQAESLGRGPDTLFSNYRFAFEHLN